MSSDDTATPGGLHDSPVFVSVVEELAQAYPDFRVAGHSTVGGQRFRLIEMPSPNGEYLSGAAGEFVSFVSELEADEAEAENSDRWGTVENYNDADFVRESVVNDVVSGNTDISRSGAWLAERQANDPDRVQVYKLHSVVDAGTGEEEEEEEGVTDDGR